MKSKKSILFVLVFCLVLLLSLLFVACNKNKKDAEPTPAPAHTHTWATVWSKDATNHWYACSGCSEKKDQAAHVYTDDSDATCNVCGYERTIGHTHTWASEWTKDATKHWHECSGCTEKNEEAVHEYTDDLDTTCNVCGYERTLAHTHSWASEWSKNDTKHWHACSGCTEKNDEAVHVYDNDHDTTCNTCGYVRSIGDHAAATAWTTTDATHHWKACTHDGCTLKFEYGEHEYDDDHDNICDECGYEREVAADHVASLDWSTNATQHWHACAHDGCTIVFDLNNHMIQNVLSYDETGHWYECSVCEYHKDFEAHVYDDNHDTTCNTCGFVRSIGDHEAATAWTKDATKHWHACQHDGCELKYNEGEHSIQSGWTTDENGHWHACDVCDLKDSYADHIYDDAHDTTCNTCSYVREIAADHTAATAWQTNETSHWHDCNHAGCTIKYSEGEHVYDDDHDTTCNTCEYVRSLGDHAAASTWTSDVTHHWKACNHSGCTIKYNYAAHTFSAGVCTVCGEKEHTPGLEFTLINNTYEVSGYTGSSLNVTIASTYKGKYVTSIGLRAFQNAIIHTLTMPDTVTNIDVDAFSGCKSMTSISLSNNLQSIGVRAFRECWALESITIPNSVTSIDQDAFYDCSALTTVVIGNGVSTLSRRMFYSCDKLANVTFSNSVHTIERDAFTYCTKLNSITFNGTIANWNAITKETGWKPSQLTTIHCTDGDVAP